MVHSQKKGKRGEDDFCKWLKKNLEIDVRREHFQASGYSADVMTEHFLFEVKRHEKPNRDNFFYQLIVAQKRHPDKNIIGVVAFRENRKPWKFLLSAKLIGLDLGYIELSEKVFISFAKTIISNSHTSR